MKHRCRASRVSPATRLEHFAEKIGNWIASQRGLWTQFPGPKLLDGRDCGDPSGHGADVKASTPNLRITLQSLSISDPYPTYN
jgi:hypothetical protein